MTATRPPARMIVLALLLGPIAGCTTMGDRGQPLVPTEYQTKTGPYVIFTGYPLPADDSVVRQLQRVGRASSRRRSGSKVDESGHPIEVYVLGDRRAFEHFLTFYYPGPPARAAGVLHRPGGPAGSSTRSRVTGSTRTSATRRRTP